MAARGGRQRFKAGLEKGEWGSGWTIARVPFVPGEVWPEMVRLRVKGEVNGYGFRTSLFAQEGGGGFYLLVNKAMMAGAGAGMGAVAEFWLEPDMEPRAAELPDELSALLDEAEGLRDWYEGLSEYTRRECGKWVLGVKSDAARLRRAEQMAERLLSVMEAERELPPLIAGALRANPKAMRGWEKMSVTHRRAHLMAVYYYQSPESRGKRLDKMVAECAAKA